MEFYLLLIGLFFLDRKDKQTQQQQQKKNKQKNSPISPNNNVDLKSIILNNFEAFFSWNFLVFFDIPYLIQN